MMHAHKRLLRRKSEGFGLRNADQQRADQAGPIGDRDRVDLFEAGPGFSQRRLDHRIDGFDMHAGSQLRDDPAVERMPLDLRGDDIAADHPAVRDNGRRGLIAGAFDCQNVDIAQNCFLLLFFKIQRHALPVRTDVRLREDLPRHVQKLLRMI